MHWEFRSSPARHGEALVPPPLFKTLSGFSKAAISEGDVNTGQMAPFQRRDQPSFLVSAIDPTRLLLNSSLKHWRLVQPQRRAGRHRSQLKGHS
jgi:hypothetical protein